MFPQIRSVVKPVFGDFHSVRFVRFDLADGAAPVLLNEQQIEDRDDRSHIHAGRQLPTRGNARWLP